MAPVVHSAARARATARRAHGAVLTRGSCAEFGNRLLHLSVQVLSDENVIQSLCDSDNLLEVFMQATRELIMLMQAPRDTTTHAAPSINCASAIARQRLYDPLASDLINITSHASVARRFLQDAQCVSHWLQCLTALQRVNPTERQLTRHIEFESEAWRFALSLELDLCAGILTNLAEAVTSGALAQRVTCQAALALADWMFAVEGMGRSSHGPLTMIYPRHSQPYYSSSDERSVSFHIPLHRFFARFAALAMVRFGIPAAELVDIGVDPCRDGEMRSRERFFDFIMEEPLRIRGVCAQVSAGLWRRNGYTLMHQVALYFGRGLHDTGYDLDLFLVQFAVAQCASPCDFIHALCAHFGVIDYLDYPSHLNVGNHAQNQDAWNTLVQLFNMLLWYLLVVISERQNIAPFDAKDHFRQEAIALLAVEDRSHSALVQEVPCLCDAGRWRARLRPTTTSGAFAHLLHSDRGGA